ncbi:hypothetical protein A2865_00075 [Candidatus Woesebacteria bacterium RIFCSPHIGHO2_01_FULL_39_17]|nr:MAG: hypothetical protein A2865_00075 [Candidatus Woesebacteria bacterium RIFCSPHIGHO2_01_FULL_39_17]OGM65451.1 MAG: hypothetical protein A3A52_00815 [Candidatus Woesebacteria bacterium RIFCSPLOWO2_01_FULL_39_14]
MQPLDLLPRGQFTPLNEISILGLIAAFVHIVLIVASVLFVFNLLFGGIKLIISGGNREKSEESRRQIVNAFIGVFIVFITWALLGFLSQFFGIDLLSFEIPTL